jgi:hypothetical protein
VFVLRLASGLFALRFFTRTVVPFLILARSFFTGMFRTPLPWRLMARRLDPAQGAPQIIYLPFVANLLFLGQLNQFQNVLHLFERFLKGFHDSAHVIHGLCERRRSMLVNLLFVAGSFSGRRPISGLWLGPMRGFWFRLISRFRLRLNLFNGRGLPARLFMWMFLRRRRRAFTGGVRWSGTGRRGGMGWTQAASPAPAATPSAIG